MITLTASAMRVYNIVPRTWNRSEKAYTFSAAEYTSEGVWHKYYMSVPPEMVQKFEKLKIREKSIVDIVAAPSYYTAKNGVPSISWVVKDIYISNTPHLFKDEDSQKNPEKAKSKENEVDRMQKQEESLASILLNFTDNPFPI